MLYKRKLKNGVEPLERGEFLKLCRRATRDCAAKGAHLWGLNVSTRWQWMTLPADPPRESCGLINGGLFGLCLRELRAPASVNLHGVADDALRTLKNFRKDGVVLRYGGYSLPPGAFDRGPVTRSAVTAESARKGQKRTVCEKRASKALATAYPELASYDATATGGAALVWSQKRQRTNS